MEISRATIGALAAVCVVAGAGGAYLVSGNRSAARLEADSPVSDAATETPTPQVAEPPIAATATPVVAPPPAVAGTSRSAASARPTAPRIPQPRATTQTAGTAGVSSRSNTTEPSEALTSSAATPEPPSQPAPEPLASAEPPAPAFEELVVAADSVLGLEIETSTTSDRAEVEDEVVARVTRDVKVGGRVAIPAGSKAHGEVTLVERGGRLRERARLGVRFTSVVLIDGTRVSLETSTVYREGDAPSRESAAKIGGGAVGGAIIGGLLGGAKGAAIGGTIGAGAGTAATLAGGRNAATLPSGTPVTVRLVEPLTVTVER